MKWRIAALALLFGVLVLVAPPDAPRYRVCGFIAAFAGYGVWRVVIS